MLVAFKSQRTQVALVALGELAALSGASVV